MLTIITHPDCLLHDPGGGHPDGPDRLGAIQNRVIASGLDFVVPTLNAPLASREELEAAHDQAYVASIFERSPATETIWIDGDTAMTPHTLAAARRAAGAAVMAVDLVMQDHGGPVFCAVRPPGHHAERGRAMGFCLFNNVAIGAAHAMARHAIERVAILDFDAHHGNGTEDIFRDDSRALLCSTFQHPFYPFTGHASDSANLVAVPLPAGTDGAGFRREIKRHWLPELEEFRPELVMISAGFDAHVLDDMSGLALVEADFAWVTECAVALARKHASGRLVSVLEGGYELGSLGRSAVAHLNALL